MWVSDEQLEVMELTGQIATGYGVLVSGIGGGIKENKFYRIVEL